MTTIPTSELCPCNNKIKFNNCCLPFLLGEKQPLSAEQLMRSRYTAYYLQNIDYLLKTWHHSTRPDFNSLNESLFPRSGIRTKWLGLKIKNSQNIDENNATVEFIATYKEGGGSAIKMQENSHFLRVDSVWFYLCAL